MTAKPVFRRRTAVRDTERAIIYYAREAGLDVSGRFVAALEAALEAIGERPGTGSPRYAHIAKMPGLRSRPVGRFPYLIFYREYEGRIEVLRVLQAQRNIQAILGGRDN